MANHDFDAVPQHIDFSAHCNAHAHIKIKIKIKNNKLKNDIKLIYDTQTQTTNQTLTYDRSWFAQ